MHSTGRAVHYEPGGPLAWTSVTLNLSMREHDVIGCGWERLEPAEIEDNPHVTGRVYFTRNGKRLAEVFDGVSTGLFPVVHIQKKVCIRFIEVIILLYRSLHCQSFCFTAAESMLRFLLRFEECTGYFTPFVRSIKRYPSV